MHLSLRRSLWLIFAFVCLSRAIVFQSNVMKCALFSCITWCTHRCLLLFSFHLQRFAALCITHVLLNLLFHSHIFKLFQSNTWKKKNIHPCQLSSKVEEKKRKTPDKNLSPPLLTAHMFAGRSPLQGLLKLSASLGVQVKWRKRQTRTSQQMMCSDAGSGSNPDLHPVCLTLIRVGGARMYCINLHADVYLLSSSGRLSRTDCVSLALTHRRWHADRWVAARPLGLPLMASTRMDGLIFKVQLVISQPAVYLLSDPLAWILFTRGE